ncbi:hypothetical protein F5Y19DRAFT_485630 [Xylariaceae sp. FL1651]|nr:hypothetical protein F5Y19DRAFT_485630 [Xylariaceae sp. FL1651]
MASQKELPATDDGMGSSFTDSTTSQKARNNKRTRPSVDIELAQGYKERQDLPPVEQGLDPDIQESDGDISPMGKEDDRFLNEIVEAKQSTVRSKQNEQVNEGIENGPSRDYVTGRVLSEDGQSCLNCTRKELRCTLNYAGKEVEPQCAACRRSKTQYCVRLRPLLDSGRDTPYSGPPWKNPNFVAGVANSGRKGGLADLSREEMEDILREHYLGRERYVLGNYIAEGKTRNFVLPPFNGVDLDERPEDWQKIGWRDVLPIRLNRSLRPRGVEGEDGDGEEGGREEQITIAMAKDQLLQPPQPTREETDGIERRTRLVTMGNNGGQDDTVSCFRALRRYEPRKQNLDDVLGETW